MKLQQLINKFQHRLSNYFFNKSLYNPLPLLRIFLCFTISRSYSKVFIEGKSIVAFDFFEGTFYQPILLRFVPVPFPLTVEQFHTLGIILFIVAFLASIGLLTRIMLFLTGCIYLYIEMSYASFGTFDHEACLVSQLLIFMTFAPGVERISLDRMLSWSIYYVKRKKLNFFVYMVGEPPVAWGIRFVLIFLSLIYFTAGYSKVRYTGWRWLDGKTLSYYVSGEPSIFKKVDAQRFISEENIPESQKWKDGFGIQAHHYANFQASPFKQNLGKFIASVPAIMIGLSIFTLVFEMGAPIMLLGGWYRIVVLLMAISLHQGIGFFMGLPFYPYQKICLLMLDWELIVKTLYKRFELFRKLVSYLSLKLKISIID
ncbi:MAG: hypothetical protein OHK0057_13770 [Thermoflexibacter sp.]